MTQQAEQQTEQAYPEQPETVGDVYAFVQAHGYDRDEYFSPCSWEVDVDDPLYGGETRWVACFWITGNSEGWYVHVDQLNKDGRRPLLLGKFWSAKRAAEAATQVTKYLNSWTVGGWEGWSRHDLKVPA